MRRLFSLGMVLTAFALMARPAHAYVTYNRLGYVSCNACHFATTGGGILSPYGRSVGAAMALFSSEKSPDEKSYYQGIQVRALALTSSTRANPFLMQADYMGSFSFLEKYRADAQIGPNLKQGSSGVVSVPSGWDGIVLRRAMLTRELTESSSIQVGREASVVGINTDDHTALLRARSRRGILDYPTQIRYLYQAEKIQLLPYFAAPSFEEANANREYGGGVRAEYLLTPSNSVGLTALAGTSPAINRAAGSFFWRLSQAHWNGLSGEFYYSRMNVQASSADIGQTNFFVRPYIALPEWIETSLVYEYMHVSDPFLQNLHQFGPELNIRIHETVSLLLDGRNLVSGGNSNWSWYGQLFLHVQI